MKKKNPPVGVNVFPSVSLLNSMICMAILIILRQNGGEDTDFFLFSLLNDTLYEFENVIK